MCVCVCVCVVCVCVGRRRGELFLSNRPLGISRGGCLCNVFCVCNNNGENDSNNGLGVLTDCLFFL